jgi:hypothetical protein
LLDALVARVHGHVSPYAHPKSLLRLSIYEKSHDPGTGLSIHNSDGHCAGGQAATGESHNIVELIHVKTPLAPLLLGPNEGRGFNFPDQCPKLRELGTKLIARNLILRNFVEKRGFSTKVSSRTGR